MHFKVSAYCGLLEEECVSNQTLKSENCLIPCTGLYADVRDTNSVLENADSTQQQAFKLYVEKGIKLINIFKVTTSCTYRFPHVDR